MRSTIASNRRVAGVLRTLSNSSSNTQATAKRVRKPKKSFLLHPTTNTWMSSPGVWIIIAFGALFCLADVMYVVRYVLPPKDDPLPDGLRGKQQREQQQQQKQQAEIHPISTDDDKSQPQGDADDSVKEHGKDEAALAMEADHPVPRNHPAHLEHPAEPANPKLPDVDEEATEVEEPIHADTVPPDASSGTGKEPILDLLREAGVPVDDDIIARLPTWQQVVDLYGDKPQIYGLDTCHAFQELNGDPANHFVSVAGTFNTGTNVMANLLIHNCHMPARMAKYGRKNRGIRWQALWGKHTPVGDDEFRKHHRTYNDTMAASDIFPAVTVRDPFKWMQSMCRHKYAADWKHDAGHCPSLVPTDEDKEQFPFLNKKEAIPVLVRYKEFDKHHTSLVDFWNTWYNEYIHGPFPRAIVRFEDIIFHPKEVTRIVCECAGGELNKGKFRYQVESAKVGKAHGTEKTSYVDSLIKYGSEVGRYTGYTGEDLAYSKSHLDPHLMEIFGYKYAPSTAAVAAKEEE